MRQPVAKVLETVCTVFWHKWPVHDLVLVILPSPLIKVASNTRPCSKFGGKTLNWREEGGQYYISQICDQERFEARKAVFFVGVSQHFATGCSFLVFSIIKSVSKVFLAAFIRYAAEFLCALKT